MTEPLTIRDKAARVDFALRLERNLLRNPNSPSRRSVDDPLRLANTLNDIVQKEGDEFKARLFDLITTYDDPEAALKALRG